MTQQEQKISRRISLVLCISSVVALALPLVVLGPKEGLALLKDVFSLLFDPYVLLAAGIGGVLTLIMLAMVARQVSKRSRSNSGQQRIPKS